jgi:RNA polymerase sigma factor (sigma-70 family)
MGIIKRFSDLELLELLRSGRNPDEGIRHLYLTQFEICRSYILKTKGTEQDAEDIFQEVVLTFIEIVRKGKFRGDSTISTFLYALNRNIWLNEVKKRSRARLRDERFVKSSDNQEQDISSLIIHRELKNELLKTVGMLGETCKKILLAFYYENLAIREILQSLNYENEQVVRNKKYKCLKKLEQIILENPVLAKNLKSVLSYE